MGLFDKIKKVYTVIFEEEQTSDVISENKKIGTEFERYVISLFEKNNKPNKKYFEIEEWRRDIDKKTTGISVASNKYPDIVMRYCGKESFAVECKYRKGFFHSQEWNSPVLKWSYDAQIKRYREYQNKTKLPVFVVIGVGGMPTKPELMFCLPLEKANYPELFPTYLEKYERDPNKPFFWDRENEDLL